MKTLKKLTTLSVFAVMSSLLFVTTAYAGDPDFIIVEPMLEPQLFGEPLVFESMPLEPIPFDPQDPYTTDPSIEINLDIEEIPGGRVALQWDRYSGPNFQYYKILHSVEDNSLYYPKTPEMEFYEDQDQTGFIHNDLQIGDNFYRICVITSDDKRGCSNVQFVFKPEPVIELEEEIMPDPESELLEEEPGFPHEEIFSEQDRANKGIVNGKPTFFQKSWKFIVDNLATIVAVLTVLTAISGFTFAAKRKQKSISKYINQIDDTYSEYKMKAKRCEAELYRLKDIIDDQLKTGKIDEGAYHLLMGRIEGYMVDIQKQIVNEKFGGLPATLKDQMFQMMEDGEITETELEAMQTLIKRSELSASEQDSLLTTIKDFKKQDELMKKKGRN